ncbi:helix-turn-helix transcriptional regulator [Lihuaxuella thermophila]|uniref:DNA-binding transcriptional regulator, XRE-family HTH domain n=1 Tax=Lihuaxuella thermophila TaxID=1173111 RepID=A0A1H8GEB3_9BACL|nr:helix-turn-helix transcriptional regulator [Lihuaxuella thermophila]SEN42313.1 DNA-binding transcriptional regulator, XRE-family HTH domain [Lihuaxuella thermophila]
MSKLKPNIELVIAKKKNEGFKIELNGKKVKCSQTHLAEKLNITKQQFSLWVNGRSFPRLEKAFELAHLLDVKVDELYTFIPEKRNMLDSMKDL